MKTATSVALPPFADSIRFFIYLFIYPAFVRALRRVHAARKVRSDTSRVRPRSFVTESFFENNFRYLLEVQ